MNTVAKDATELLTNIAVPVVCSTPLGLPVLPEVYNRNRGSSDSIHSTCRYS